MSDEPAFDAFLLVSFGGPEGPDEVIPFLENVLRGRNVPRERLLEVAEHYQHFGGVSPINAQNRALIAALRSEFAAHGIALPIYWGNRNWHPLLADTLRQMRDDGIRRALALATSAFGSYSGCRQYLEDLVRARAAVGEGAPLVEKLRGFFNHPGFIETMCARLTSGLEQLAPDRRPAARVLFTAHSIPSSMAVTSPYVAQLQEACRLVALGCGVVTWSLVYQSRSGPPTQPWLEPDVGDALRGLPAKGVRDVVVVPIGFLSDHMEVLYDLDTEAAELAHQLGLNMIRTGTVGTHPRFVAACRELVQERLSGNSERRRVGDLPAPPDACAAGCCPPPARPTGSPGSSQSGRS